MMVIRSSFGYKLFNRGTYGSVHSKAIELPAAPTILFAWTWNVPRGVNVIRVWHGILSVMVVLSSAQH